MADLHTFTAEQTPILTRLLEHSGTHPWQFHIPGHKCGKGMDPQFRSLIGDKALAIDLINIAPLDDLHCPTGVIQQAEEMAAKAFAAEHSFFSINGTSGAIMAMIMATCQPGDKIIVPRNAHKSVTAALILAGVEPVFVQPEIDPYLQIAHGVALETVAEALCKEPTTRAILVVNPTYYGVCIDLRRMAELAHEHSIPLLVDEAHGAHLYFHDNLPVSAMDAGADLAATSMHKLCGSLTQSSVLNLQGNRVSTQRVRALLSVLTSTSTSYLLLASLDAARRHMALYGREALEQTLQLAESARRQINQIPGLYCFGDEIIGQKSSSIKRDPSKLCISFRSLGISGITIERILRDEYNLEVEMSEPFNVLCIVTIGDTQESVDYLVRSLREIAQRYPTCINTCTGLPQIGEHTLALTPREAFYAPTEQVALDQTIGRIAAEFVHVYPPGIPLLVPGELVTQNDVAYIRAHQALGFIVQGPEDTTISSLKVVSSSSTTV